MSKGEVAQSNLWSPSKGVWSESAAANDATSQQALSEAADSSAAAAAAAMLSVSRCITFGKGRDPSESEAILQREFDAEYERAKGKWNFDFYNEKPLPGGRYQWESVFPPPPPCEHRGRQTRSSSGHHNSLDTTTHHHNHHHHNHNHHRHRALQQIHSLHQ